MISWIIKTEAFSVQITQWQNIHYNNLNLNYINQALDRGFKYLIMRDRKSNTCKELKETSNILPFFLFDERLSVRFHGEGFFQHYFVDQSNLFKRKWKERVKLFKKLLYNVLKVSGWFSHWFENDLLKTFLAKIS